MVKNGLEDLYLGEIAKRRLLKGEWIDFEEMERYLDDLNLYIQKIEEL